MYLASLDKIAKPKNVKMLSLIISNGFLQVCGSQYMSKAIYRPVNITDIVVVSTKVYCNSWVISSSSRYYNAHLHGRHITIAIQFIHRRVEI